MAVTNTDVNQQQGTGSSISVGKNKKEYFTFLQAVLMIILTIAISTGGWYVVGKKFFWTGLDRKRVNEQLEFLQKKVEAEPKNNEYRTALGYTWFLKGENDKAIREYNQVLEVDKNYYDARYNLGLVFADEARYDDALDQFQKCIELAPKDYKGYIQKGIVYRKMKMYKEAVELLDKATIMIPGKADVTFELGRVFEDMGDKKGAAEVYKEALALDPLYKDAAEGLKRVQ